MANRDASNSWHETLSFYDSLASSGWEHIPAFRALVAKISESPQARGLTAITSHDTLTVSPYTLYPDWFDGRRVQLHPLADGRIRVTRYSEHPPETWVVTVADGQNKILNLLAEL